MHNFIQSKQNLAGVNARNPKINTGNWSNSLTIREMLILLSFKKNMLNIDLNSHRL